MNPLLEKKDQLTGMHANTQIPKVIGFKRIADLDGEKAWSDASDFLLAYGSEQPECIYRGK